MKKAMFAFVLMPFSKEFDDVYRLGIKESVEGAGIIAERVDEQVFHSEKILERIYNQIEIADFIIADMTGRNPNVFYEVGYAHAKGKTCILLTSSADDIPFDLKHHRHIVYGNSITTLKSALASDLQAVRSELASKSAPIAVSLHWASGELEKTKWSATGVVDLRFDMNNGSDRASPEIDMIYLYTGDGWEFSQDKSDCPSSKSDAKEYALRHMVTSPVRRLQKEGWARLSIKGKKTLATSYKGEVLLDEYKLTGVAMIRVVTNSGSYDFTETISVTCIEFPF
jgi:hypothetical protein